MIQRHFLTKSSASLRVLWFVACCVTVISCQSGGSRAGHSAAPNTIRVAVFGASGRIGGHIAQEALDRGYQVTGVSRDPARLDGKFEEMPIAQADILDRAALQTIAQTHDVLLVSVGGKPTNQIPEDYIAYQAALSLIEVLSALGEAGPRVIFVGNLFTLKYEADKTLLELGRVNSTHENYAMFYGHQLALDRFRASKGVNWTVASPPNGLRLKGRTAQVRWGEEVLIRDEDGKPSTISPEDFAYAVVQEMESNRYLRKRFTVAR